MNSYDENPDWRSRAARHDWDEAEYPEERPTGRASVGRASVGGPGGPSGPTTGRASVPGPVDPYGPTYEPHAQSRDPYSEPYSGSHGGGSRGYGGDQYGGDQYGGDQYGADSQYPGGAYYEAPPGPVSPGRGVVGRASVRPTSPGGGMGGGLGPDAPVYGPGYGPMPPGAMVPPGPMGPGGPIPGGPGGRGPGGPGGRGPRGPFGRGRGPDDGDEGDDLGDDGEGRGGRFARFTRGRGGGGAGKKSKKSRRRNILIASFAVFIMLTGVGVVGGTYMVNSVVTPEELPFPETTTLYYADGSELAKLGEVTRYSLKYAEMNDAVKQAIVASEDKTFWTNEGVDVNGVLRAAWNNFTGGEQQGASTITQQYARVAYDLKGGYSRKIKEAVLAWRLDDELSKEQILEYYLNSVPFGRQTYGIEAAAQSFFGKTVKANAKPEDQITKAQAMALVLMVKQPNPNPDDPKGEPGYDPTFSPEAETLSRDRWEYVHGQMKELGYLTAAEDAALKYPPIEQWKKYNPDAGNGVEQPAGLIINHVLSELNRSNSQFKGMSWKAIREGGYKIYTTLNKGAQAAAEKAADETVNGSYMFGQPKNLQAALVAVEPGTGRVLAYYGGHDGKGSDFAGIYFDEAGDGAGFGSHPAGSSFKVYTLAAALRAGVSLNSYWNWNPHDMPGRTGPKQIRNASTCPGLKSGDPTPCSLLNSTIASLNVPFYELTVSVTAAAVMQMAKDAGIEYMWSPKGRQSLLEHQSMNELVPGQFDHILGIGQYPVTVLDHANGVATMAAGGLKAEAHFVTKVLDGDKPVYSETLPANNQPRIMNQQAVNDLTYALSKVSSASVPGIGWDTAGKTGTWEYNGRNDQNAHAWMVGFDKKLAAAVWVGNKKEEQAIKDKGGSTIWGSGIPTSIWKKFMSEAMKAMNPKKENTKFNAPNFIGNENPQYSVPSPTPPPPPDPGLPPNPTGTPGNGGVGFPFPTKTRNR